jgi:hypothetical protein
MTGFLVNIAEFRCRAIKRRAGHVPQHAFAPVASLTIAARLQPEARTHAPASNGAVCDIGLAREAQRLRPRIVIRPVSKQRRANVIRFGERKILVMGAGESLRLPQRPMQPDGPGDSPPAA